jgi:drug/metabolite transporter (DMT)-like permease
MVVFIYPTLPLTALGLHFFVRGERLTPRQWLGVLFLDEPLTGYFAVAAPLVGAGIVLVNLRR